MTFVISTYSVYNEGLLKMMEKMMIRNDPFIGRKQELKELQRFLKKKSASIIVVQGRRRIGKSRLIEEFAKNSTFYSFVGLPPDPKVTAQDQRNEFAKQLSPLIDIPNIQTGDWTTLFQLLATKVQKGRVIILLDEISWMGSEDPTFLGKLKNAWDLLFKKNPELILIICGSASAWIERNILSRTGYLGRVSFTLTLDELPLKECNEFWANVGAKISPYEKFKIFSITGGIPRYLEEIQPQKPAEENIQDLCFKKGALLVHEFERIFSDLFSTRSEQYKKIVSGLADGPLEYAGICQKLEVGKSGLVSEYLEDLILSGFISRDYSWHFRSKAPSVICHYRLRDNYLRFYLKYIEKYLPEIEKNAFRVKSLSSLPAWSTVIGLQFENLVLQNREYIQESLHIRPEDIITDNPYFQRQTARSSGCQIDYLIQTRFNTLFACEIRFSRQEVKGDIIQEMKQKLDRLSLPRGFSCCPVLIHVNGVSDAVIDAGYFTEIIDFTKLLDDNQ